MGRVPLAFQAEPLSAVYPSEDSGLFQSLYQLHAVSWMLLQGSYSICLQAPGPTWLLLDQKSWY